MNGTNLSPRSALQRALKQQGDKRALRSTGGQSHATKSFAATDPTRPAPKRQEQATGNTTHQGKSQNRINQRRDNPNLDTCGASRRGVGLAVDTAVSGTAGNTIGASPTALMSPAARAYRQVQAGGFGSQPAPTAEVSQRALQHPKRSRLKSDQDLARLLHAFGQQHTPSQEARPPKHEHRDASPAAAAPTRRSLSELQAEQKASQNTPPPNTGLRPPVPPPRKSSLSGPRQPSVVSSSTSPARSGEGHDTRRHMPPPSLRDASATTPDGPPPGPSPHMPRLTLPPDEHPARWFTVGLKHHAPQMVDALGMGAACQMVLAALRSSDKREVQSDLEDLLGDNCLPFIATLLASRSPLLKHRESILDLASQPEASVSGVRPGNAHEQQPVAAALDKTGRAGQLSAPLVRSVPVASSASPTRARPSGAAAYNFGSCDDEASDFEGDLFADAQAVGGAIAGRPFSAPVSAAGATDTTGESTGCQAGPVQLAGCMDADTARKRASALSELINSEANYIALLLRLVHCFEVPCTPTRSRPEVEPLEDYVRGTALNLVHTAQGQLKGPENAQGVAGGSPAKASMGDFGAGLLSDGEHAMLFRHVHKLLPLHYTLLQQLVNAAQRASDMADQSEFLFGAEGDGGAAGARLDCVTPHTAPFVCVGALVAQCARRFSRAYAPYVAGHGSALQLLGDLTGAHKKFTEWLRSSEASCGGQTLQSFLIMPVQRIPRYALLLKEVVACTPEAHPEFGMLNEALRTSKKAAQDINTAVADVAEREKVGALQAALSPAPTPTLVRLGARVIKTGWVDKVTGGSSLREYLVVLLPTQLVYASVSRASEALLAHREAYKAAAYRLGDPDTRLAHQERALLHSMRVAYHAAEDAAGDPSDDGVAAAKAHAERVWDDVFDPSQCGILPNSPVPVEGTALSLHNCIALQNVLARTVQGKPALRIEGPPKCITLVFHSSAERDEWAFAIRAMLQKADELAQAAQLGEGGYNSVWSEATEK